MDRMLYWLNLPVPLWILLATLFAFMLASYLIGHRQKQGEVKEAVHAEFIRRRNDLADRGRTTERRPEHEGRPSAVNRRIQVVGRRPSPPDKPRNQL
jgi:hypothetical protein